MESIIRLLFVYLLACSWYVHEFQMWWCFFQPKAVTDTEEAELQKKMDQAEAENMEISGDEDSEEGEYEGMGAVDDDDDKANAKENAEPVDEESVDN